MLLYAATLSTWNFEGGRAEVGSISAAQERVKPADEDTEDPSMAQVTPIQTHS